MEAITLRVRVILSHTPTFAIDYLVAGRTANRTAVASFVAIDRAVSQSISPCSRSFRIPHIALSALFFSPAQMSESLMIRQMRWYSGKNSSAIICTP
jgi:hypothetical protein